MKRVLALLLPMLLIFAGCAKNNPPTTTGSTEPLVTTAAPTTEPATEPTEPEVTFEAPLVALSMPIATIETSAEDGALLCTHTTQAFSLIMQNADAAQMITDEFTARTDSGNRSARLVYEAALQDYAGQTDWMPYSYSNVYSPARLDHVVLSLYGSQLIYDGSAGYTSVDLSVTYDLLTGNPLDEISQVLVSDFSADTLCDLIYAQLTSLADEGLLYTDYQYTISDMFATNTPVRNWYLSNSGLCFYFMPYELAPHSAGTIITQIPYSQLNGILQDRYFPEEMVEMAGRPVLSAYTGDAEYAQIAELSLEQDGKNYALYAEGALLDVTISIGQAGTAEEVTIFAAASLGFGDAVMLQCSEEHLTSLSITYLSEGQYKTALLSDYLQ